MLLILSWFVVAATAAPVEVDQRQEGELNIRADLKNVVLLIAIPQKLPFSNLLGGFKSNADSQIQERADVHAMEAFLEPPTPYQVDLTRNHNYEGDGRAVEVLIAGRRSESVEDEKEEIKLLGARENCGPGRTRDPTTLMCRDEHEETPSPNQIDAVKEKDPSPPKSAAIEDKVKSTS